MEYNRLTEKIDGIVQPIGCQGDECIELYDSCNCKLMDEVLCRLCELENKIEDGTLIELPCKVGDPVYHLLGKCGGQSCPYNGDYGLWRCSYKGERRCNAFVDEIPFELSHLADIGVHIFLTREEAEEAMKARGY